ncbi:MAG: signal peptidase II [Acidimicrobiales bacterium]
MSAAGVDRSDATGGVRPAGATGHGRRIRVALLVALAVLVADQVTKSLAVSRLSSGSIHLIGPFALVLSYNTGVAFSIGTGLGLPIVVIVVVIVALVAWFGRTVPNIAAAVGVGMILGGATGNLADRLFRGHHGAVVDFFYSGFWPTFNVADASIVCGCIVLAVALFRATGAARSRETEEHSAP